MSEKKSIKKRNWAFVVYPDSLPDNWKEILMQTGLPVAISPLHDKDLNADNTPKKPHYHVIAVFSGPTTFNAVKAITDALNAPIPQPLESVKGYFRYLTHKDNPEKAQYSDSDIEYLNGFCIGDFVELSKSEVLAIIKRIQAYIREGDILEYSDLLDMLVDSDMSDEFDVASSHTFLFNSYITSRRNKAEQKKKKEEQKDPLTF